MIKKSGSHLLSLLVLLASSPFVSQAQNDNVTKQIHVTGEVEFVSPTTPNKVYLIKESMSGKSQAVDSVIVDEQNKSFSFVLNQDHPGIYVINAFNWDRATFWSDADVRVSLRGYDTAKMKIKIPTFNFVEGSMDNNFINLYNQLSQLNYLRMVDEYNQEYYAKQNAEKDSAWAIFLKNTKKYNPLNEDYNKRKEALMKSFAGQPVIIYALRENIGPDHKERYEEVMTQLDGLIAKYPWLTEAKEAKKTITENMERAMSLQPGKPAPSISYPDDKGKLQGLEKYKGKYVLMDFWASWCGPCRAAVPKVKELYTQYHKSGLEIVSISIDEDKDAWRKAMKEEKMPWEQLLSPNLNETMKLFQFGGIPTLYIVDPAGKIIERYLGYSPEAEKSIKSILDNKKVAPGAASAMPAMSF